MSTTASSAPTELSGAEDWPMFHVNTQIELRHEGVFTLIQPVIQAASVVDATTAAAATVSTVTAIVPAGV